MKSLIFLLVYFCYCVSGGDVASGFVLGRTDSGKNQTLRIVSTSKVQLLVQSFRIENTPEDLLTNDTFSLVPDMLSSDRNVWFNGEEYCYMINHASDTKAPYGTWLIGKKVGVDSGMMYFKPTRPSISPVTNELGGPLWRVLKGREWESSDTIVVTQLGTVSPPMHFSTVEYITGGSLQSSVLLFSNPATLGVEVHIAMWMLSTLSGSGEMPPPTTPGPYPYLWDKLSSKWAPFTIDQTIPFGAPRVLRTPLEVGGDRGGTESIVHLVNVEHLYTEWRLSLRTTNAGDEVEIITSIGSDSLLGGYVVAGALDYSTSSSTQDYSALSLEYHQDMQANIGNMEVGSYAWMFYQSDRFLGKGCGGNVCDNNLVLKCITASKSLGHGDSSPYASDVLIFQYFESDRRDMMDRTLLSQTSSVVVAIWRQHLHAYEIRLEGTALSVHSIFVIERPVQWIAQHLTTHEKLLTPQLSSCFLYHAGVSLPQQFVYAAEIICVLMGAKPVVMVRLVGH